jgi:hypothetical protein
MEPEMNYKFTAILIVAICLLALFGGHGLLACPPRPTGECTLALESQ